MLKGLCAVLAALAGAACAQTPSHAAAVPAAAPAAQIAAFDVRPGDRLYLSVDERVHIW